MERGCGGRRAAGERGWENNGGGSGVGTATTARAALRGGHVARAALGRDGSRGALGSPPQPMLTQTRETPRDSAPRRPTVPSVLAEPSNGVRARGCDDVLMRGLSLRLRVDRSERSPL